MARESRIELGTLDNPEVVFDEISGKLKITTDNNEIDLSNIDITNLTSITSNSGDFDTLTATNSGSGTTTTDSLTVNNDTTTSSLTVNNTTTTDSLTVNNDTTTNSLTVNNALDAGSATVSNAPANSTDVARLAELNNKADSPHGNADHSQEFVSDGDGTTRQIWVIANGASDPSGADPEDIIFEEEA